MSAVKAECADVANSLHHRLSIQRKAEDEPEAEAAIPKGAGQPLGAGVRKKIEPKLGADLGDVRVHTGGESARAATQLGARAFTTGNDVHFAAGQFSPGTKEGDRLLVHELTHVVQGQRSGVQRKADAAHDGASPDGAAAGHEVSQPGEPAEQEADAVADKVTDDLHGAAGKKHDDKQKQPGKDDQHNHGSAGSEPSAAGAHGAAEHPTEAPAAEAPKPIAAKLESGVGRKIHLSARSDAPVHLGSGGRKIFRAPAPPTRPTGPTGSGSGGAGAGAGGAAADPELRLPEMQQQLVDVLAVKNHYTAAEVAPLARKLAPAGKIKKSEFDAKKTGNLEPDLLLEWRLAAGDEAFAKDYSKPDPIAARNLAQVDSANPAHFEGGGSVFAQCKKGFYDAVSNELLSGPKRPTCFNKAFFPASTSHRFKGKKITDKLPQFMQRAMAYTDFRDYNVDVAELGRQACAWYNGRTGKNVNQAAFDALPDAQKLREDYLKQAGGDESAIRRLAKGTFTFRANWWTPNSLDIKAGEAGFAQLMTIFALEPQYFADGSVFMTCDLKAVSDPKLLEARKPTCFDGMQSAMWAPREQGGEVFGVTGGGIQEALCKGVDAKSITKFQCNFPAPDVAAAIKSFDAQIQAKTGGSAANALERAQGDPKATANVAQGMQHAGPGGGAALNLQMGVSNRTEQERKKPTSTAQAEKNSSVQSAGTPRPRTV